MNRLRQFRKNMSLLLVVLFAGAVAKAQTPAAAPDLDSIVAHMEQRDLEQRAALTEYRSLRHYTLEYHGFMRKVNASMTVQANYRAGSGKSFQIVSQSGSRALCQKVLSRALDSEREASLTPSSTALNRANYRFRFAGREQDGGREVYVLDVEPLAPSKFLYVGRIWVDAASYAVVRMQVQPGKNPSFLISRTKIEHVNSPVDGVWLASRNRSESDIRIGGSAVMTIDYGDYVVSLATPSDGSQARLDARKDRQP